MPPRRPTAYALRHLPALSTGLFHAAPFRPETHLPRIAAAGFRAIELRCFMGPDGLDDFDWRSPEKVRRLKQLVADLGLAVWSVHAPQTAALSELHTAAYRHDVDNLRGMVDLALDLGASCIPFHGMRQVWHDETAPQRADAWRRVFDGVMPVVEYARSVGVTLAWETGTWPHDDLQAEEWVEIVRPLPQGGLGLALDTGHAHITGVLDAFLRQPDQRLCTVHLQDNDGRRDLHLPPGAGTIDWPRCLALLRAAGYVGPLLFEPTAGPDPDEQQRIMAACLAQARLWAEQTAAS